MVKWFNTEVCKTSIHRFESGRRLHRTERETGLTGRFLSFRPVPFWDLQHLGHGVEGIGGTATIRRVDSPGWMLLTGAIPLVGIAATLSALINARNNRRGVAIVMGLVAALAFALMAFASIVIVT